MATQRVDLLAALGPLVRQLRGIEDEAAARVGLSMWQYAVLAVLAEAPGLNQGEVAARLGYSANRIIADLDLLQRRRLISRVPGPDRRANVLATTPTGKRLVRSVRAEIRRGEDRLLASLPDEQRRLLGAAIGTVTRGLDRADG